MYGYIYLITDTTNGKQYIGQHKYDKAELDPTYHGSGHIIKEIYKIRPKTLIEELLFVAETLEELNYFEIYFIEHLNTLYPNGYNLNTGGKYFEFSEETKKKCSYWGGKTGPMKGKHHTDETKRKISEKHKGIKPWNKGVQQTEEHKRKNSEAHKGQIPWCTGMKMDIEFRRNVSIGHRKLPWEEIYGYYINNKLSFNELAIKYNSTPKKVRSLIRRIIKRKNDYENK